MSKSITALLGFMAITFQLALIPKVIAAQSIENLVNQNKLMINLSVNQQEKYIVGQAVILAIEISTDRWFAAGSKIEPFNLTDVIIQANNTTTINGSKRMNGQMWATQTHEITVYPSKSGTYQVPPIRVDIAINTELDGIVSGVLTTQESRFSVELPEALEGIESFIVSPQVTLSIDSQFDQARDYAVGEAITQTITITASDTPAMMIMPINLLTHNLPAATLDSDDLVSNDKTTLDGVSIYRKPAKIFDQTNRGELLGTRVESSTYIFEKPGRYLIDEKVIYWWNSQTSTLEQLLIPAITWSVSGGALTQFSTTNALKEFDFTLANAISFISVIILITLSYFAFLKRAYLSNVYNKLTKREQRRSRHAFLDAVAEKNHLSATQYLYQYRLLSKTQACELSCSLVDKLNQLAFNGNNAKNSSLSFSVHDAKALIKKIDLQPNIKIKSAYFSPSERINLNNANNANHHD